jgi:hypothetical protein
MYVHKEKYKVNKKMLGTVPNFEIEYCAGDVYTLGNVDVFTLGGVDGRSTYRCNYSALCGTHTNYPRGQHRARRPSPENISVQYALCTSKLHKCSHEHG